MEYWKLCSSCKKEIGFETKYYKCSVSSCNGERTGYHFCSMQCFERHIPGARHRDASAVINYSPSQQAMSSGSPRGLSAPANSENDVLVVVSKLKNYIRDKSDMNTSGDVSEILSQMIRRLCDEAIDHARQDGRKTVMARDFQK